jgi:hypothetical protein
MCLFIFYFYAIGLSFGVEAIVSLDGSLLFEEIMQAKEVIRLSNKVLID